MEKSDLYYLVRKGTNIRATTRKTEDVVIIKASDIERVARNYPEYERITIKDFEQAFEGGE